MHFNTKGIPFREARKIAWCWELAAEPKRIPFQEPFRPAQDCWFYSLLGIPGPQSALTRHAAFPFGTLLTPALFPT
jgi:hypothetical protein